MAYIPIRQREQLTRLPDRQLNWIRRYTPINVSKFSEAQANYLRFGIIIKEEFSKALERALKSDLEERSSGNLDGLFKLARSHPSLSVASAQLETLTNKYRQLRQAKMDPKTFSRFVDQARHACMALDAGTDFLDASKNSSLVNEFSAAGLQILIKQPGQAASDSNIWIKGHYLGGGSFGKVYTLTHYPTEKVVAIKIVEMQSHYTETEEEVKQLQNEIEILSTLRHKRIVSCHGVERKGNRFYLFVDFMNEGSLRDYIKRNGTLDENLCRNYTRQLLEGVDFLHSKEIIHRDIKGANVLLDRNGNVKLADFGISRKIKKIDSKTNLKTSVGTVYWMAPEIARGEQYGRKADIWSVGCTVVEMLTGDPPLVDLHWAAAMYCIGKGPPEPKLPEGVSLDAINFVRVALTLLPAERPWCGELLRHVFIQPIVSDHWEDNPTTSSPTEKQTNPLSIPGVLMEVEFDAVLVHSTKDEEWVFNTLLPLLEQKHGLKCCVNIRDFVIGRPFKENLADGIYKSRKTVAVVSRSFSSRKYCKYNNRDPIVSMSKLLSDRVVSRLLERKGHSVVIIKLDDVDTKKLSNALKKKNYIFYIDLSKKTRMWEEELVDCLKSPC